MMARRFDLQHFNQNMPIVDLSTGRPTDYFMRAMFGGTENQLDAEDWTVQGGAGIDGGGPVSDGVTLDANTQEILDAISSAQGSILYRGAADWSALAPGTSGRFLKTLGAGADPEWGAAAGGGAWSLVDSWTQTVDGDVAEIIVVGLDAFTELKVVARLVTKSVSGIISVSYSTDGGSTYFTTSGDYQILADVGTEAAATGPILHSTNATAARSGLLDIQNTTGLGVPAHSLSTSTEANSHIIFVADLVNPIDALRIFPSGGGNFNGGSIWVLGR